MTTNSQIGAIIPIENRNGQQAVNARNLYEWLGIRKDFSNWIKSQILRCDLVQNVDYQSFAQKVEREIGGTTRIEYALSLNAAKEISMMSQTEKGKQARRYFIECERLANEKSQLVLPVTYKEAIEHLLASLEDNEHLQQENEKLMAENEVRQNIINLQMGELHTLTPKGRIYDQVINTPQDDRLKTTSSVANEIGMSAQKLNAMLVACGIIYKAPDGEYLFCSEYRGWNLGKSVSVTINEETGRIKTYIKWNTRGRSYIHALNDCNWDKRRAWRLINTGKEVAV